jgi:membrane protease YdiL (CAAX protease family)
MERRNLRRIGLATLASLVAFEVFAEVVVLTLMSVSTTYGWSEQTLYILQVVASTCATAFALLIFWLMTRKVQYTKPIQSKLPASKFIVLLLSGYAVLYIGAILGKFVSVSVTYIFSGEGGSGTGVVDDMVNNIPMWVIIVFLVILAPILEELFFRKVLLDRLRPYGYTIAVPVTAVLFGAYHRNFEQFFYATALGLILGAVAYKSGRIFYSILMHMIINFLGSAIPIMVTNGGDAAVIIYGLLAIVVVILGIVFFFVSAKGFLLQIPWEDTITVSLKRAWGNVGIIISLSFAFVFAIITAVAT